MARGRNGNTPSRNRPSRSQDEAGTRASFVFGHRLSAIAHAGNWRCPYAPIRGPLVSHADLTSAISREMTQTAREGQDGGIGGHTPACRDAGNHPRGITWVIASRIPAAVPDARSDTTTAPLPAAASRLVRRLRARARTTSYVRPPRPPVWRRCSSVEYCPYAPSSRLASRAPRRPTTGTYSCADPQPVITGGRAVVHTGVARCDDSP